MENRKECAPIDLDTINHRKRTKKEHLTNYGNRSRLKMEDDNLLMISRHTSCTNG